MQPFAIVERVRGRDHRARALSRGGRYATLDAEQLRALAQLGADLEERLGTPQDIEWAVEDGELYVLQARPVTT